MKRIVSLVLVALMLLAIVPFAAFNAEAATFTHLTNVAKGKTVITSRTNKGIISAYHPINCNTSLTDGKYTGDISGATIANNSWFAFQTYTNTETTGSYGTIGSAIIDLEAAYDLHSVMVHLGNHTTTLTNGTSFTAKADKVEVFVSNNANGPFTYAGTCDTTVNKGNYWARILLDSINARYVKIAITINTPNVGVHYAILDEIEIYTQEHTEIANPVNTTVRIGSFNIAHVGQFTFTKANLDSLANDILSADLDIVGLQEAVCGIFSKGTSNERYIDSVAELKARTGYEYCYYINWDDTSNTGLGIMSRYPIANLGQGTIVKTPIWSISKDGDGAYNSKEYNTVPNYAASEKAGSDFLQFNVNGTIINFWNTHSRPADYAKSFTILDGTEENFIMLGDFNNPTYEALHDFKLANGVKLSDYTSIVNNHDNKIVTYPKDKKFMDNIFYTDDFRLLASGAVENFSGASDHFLMWAEFEIISNENIVAPDDDVVVPMTNLALNKTVTTSRTNAGVTSAWQPIKCNASLTDGIASDKITASSIGDNTWFAFQTYANTETTGSFGTVGTAIVDLEKVSDIDSVRVHLANINITLSNGAVFNPKATKVEVLVSNTKNGNYTSVGSVNTSSKNGSFWAEIDLNNVSARYVKLAITVNAPDQSAYYAILNEIQVIGK